MVRTKDASDDATNVQAFKLAMEAGSLVAVIAGQFSVVLLCSIILAVARGLTLCFLSR